MVLCRRFSSLATLVVCLSRLGLEGTKFPMIYVALQDSLLCNEAEFLHHCVTAQLIACIVLILCFLRLFLTTDEFK